MVIKFLTACGCEKLEEHADSRTHEIIRKAIYNRRATPPVYEETLADAVGKIKFYERVFELSHREAYYFVYTERFSS